MVVSTKIRVIVGADSRLWYRSGNIVLVVLLRHLHESMLEYYRNMPVSAKFRYLHDLRVSHW